MNIFPALVKREFLDGYNGYFRVPAVLLAITIGLVLISAMGVGNYLVIDDLEVKGISNLGDAMQKALDRGGFVLTYNCVAWSSSGSLKHSVSSIISIKL